MRVLLLIATAFALSACSIIYKLPTRQGNIIDQKQLDQLKIGMSQEQVHYLMGTPIAASAFRPDRWDYVGYYKSPRGDVSERVVSLHFQGDVLARMEGLTPKGETKAIDNSDVTSVINGEKKDAKREARDRTSAPASGVVLTPPGQTPD
jgi:outer membrane protein assembly factor BamE (lipoprotein component of BamABCDE complex)